MSNIHYTSSTDTIPTKDCNKQSNNNLNIKMNGVILKKRSE